MKKFKIAAPLLLALNFFSSCEKEKDDLPSFSAVGIWKGPITFGLGTSALFVNQPDGTSKLYFYDGQTDTSATASKFFGSYSVKDNVFFGNYPNGSTGFIGRAETSHTSLNAMSGAIFIIAPDHHEISIAFEVFKQQ